MSNEACQQPKRSQSNCNLLLNSVCSSETERQTKHAEQLEGSCPSRLSAEMSTSSGCALSGTRKGHDGALSSGELSGPSSGASMNGCFLGSFPAPAALSSGLTRGAGYTCQKGHAAA